MEAYVDFAWNVQARHAFWPLEVLLGKDDLERLRVSYQEQLSKMLQEQIDTEGRLIDEHIMLWCLARA